MDDFRLVIGLPIKRQGVTADSMSTAREGHAGVRLANNKVLISGGSSGGVTLATSELYDPSAGTWTVVGPLHRAVAPRLLERTGAPLERFGSPAS